jgi:hypothetical protein
MIEVMIEVILNEVKLVFRECYLNIFTSTPSLKTRCRGYRFGLN